MVVLYTGTTWCPPCIQMEKDTWPNEDIIALRGAFQWVKFDVPRKPSDEEGVKAVRAMMAAQITGVPTLQIHNAQGKILHSQSGFIHSENLRALLISHL